MTSRTSGSQPDTTQPLLPVDRQRLLAADDAEARCALLCRLLAEEAEVLAAELALGDGPDETP